MAIKIITGVPGSGKSYYALHKVILESFQFDKKYFDWQPIPGKECTIVTNIESLRLPYFDLNQLVQEYANGDFSLFFTVPIQQLLTDKYPRIRYIIDECQRYFHSKFHDKETFYYFQYHRHLGHDIYMIAQVWDSISKHITGLCEYEFRANPRTISLRGEFRYLIYCGFDKVGSVTLPPDKRIFALYQSFQQADHGKTINPIRRWLFMLFGLFLLVSFSLWYFVTQSSILGGATKTKKEAAAVRATAPPASPASTSSSRVLVRQPQPAFTPVYTSGLFLDGRPVYIQWQGHLVQVKRFPHQWTLQDDGRILVLLPESALNVVNGPLPSPPSAPISTQTSVAPAVRSGEQGTRQGVSPSGVASAPGR